MSFIKYIADVGSANLTGAGMGMKSPRKRNFEAGILTDDPEMVEAAIEQFDNVWMGKFCKDCGRREITLTEPPTGKRKQYDKQGEEMKYGRMK